MSELLNAALSLVAMGVPVFPVNPQNKTPLLARKKDANGRDIPRTGGIYKASTDAQKIKAWWGRWPGALIGVPTGRPETFNVLDIDSHEGKPNGYLAIPEWESLSTKIAKTRSHGAHLFFKSDPEILNVASRIAPGIDVRSLGGFVILPPSPGYSWHKGADVTFADLPPWPEAYRPASILRGNVERKPGKPEKPIEWVRAAVSHIPNDDLGWDDWNAMGMAIWRATGGSGDGYEIFDDFSRKSDKHVSHETAERWEQFYSSPPDAIGYGSLDRKATQAFGSTAWKDELQQADDEFDAVEIDVGKKPKRGVSLDDFVSFMETHSYIFKPTRAFWPAGSVNALIKPVKLFGPDGKPLVNKKGEEMMQNAAAWLDTHRHVEQMTWCPGLPMLIRDRLVSEGGWIDWPGVTCFNLYRPPVIKPGDASAVGPWIELVHRVFPDDAEHLILWFAHRIQHPDDKINHAIVLGGDQGIGKDSILEPVKRAVGPWNFQEVSPAQLLGRFNGFLKSVILRVSEARDLGEMNRYQFYDHTKPYMASPPDVLRVDEKHAREYSIVNCTGVIITTNHKGDGIFLPPDDRRHFVAWSPRVRGDISDDDWKRLWDWYGNGGDRHVAAYLATLDLSGFNAKSPPKRTQAFWDIVGANQAPETAELSDVLDRLSWPDAVTLDAITDAATTAMADDGVDFRSIVEWLKDQKSRRIIPHRLGECGYVPVRNDAAKDGHWKINGKRRAVYARKELVPSAAIVAARRL